MTSTLSGMGEFEDRAFGACVTSPEAIAAAIVERYKSWEPKLEEHEYLDHLRSDIAAAISEAQALPKDGSR